MATTVPAAAPSSDASFGPPAVEQEDGVEGYETSDGSEFEVQWRNGNGTYINPQNTRPGRRHLPAPNEEDNYDFLLQAPLAVQKRDHYKLIRIRRFQGVTRRGKRGGGIKRLRAILRKHIKKGQNPDTPIELRRYPIGSPPEELKINDRKLREQVYQPAGFRAVRGEPSQQTDPAHYKGFIPEKKMPRMHATIGRIVRGGGPRVPRRPVSPDTAASVHDAYEGGTGMDVDEAPVDEAPAPPRPPPRILPRWVTEAPPLSRPPPLLYTRRPPALVRTETSTPPPLVRAEERARN